MASAEYQTFFREEVAFGIIPKVKSYGVEAPLVMATVEDFGSDGKEFTFIVRGAATLSVPLNDRRPENIPFPVNHPCHIGFDIVVHLQRDALAEVAVVSDTFIIVCQPPFRIPGGRQQSAQLLALEQVGVLPVFLYFLLSVTEE